MIITIVASVIGVFSRKYFQNINMLVRELETNNISLQEHQASMEETIAKRTQKVNQMNRELVIKQTELKNQKRIIEHQLEELNTIKENLELTVTHKTKELQQANNELMAQNAQLEQYAYITAHNLRAPVARMKGLTHLYELQKGRGSQYDELFNKIDEAATDMNDVLTDINKILEIKNFNQQDRVPINISRTIEKITKRLEDRIRRNNINILMVLQVETINSIETYFESILYNLIYNGIKYYRDNATAYVEISTQLVENKLIMQVKDNGVGIDLKKYGDKLFGLYQRFHDHVNGKGMGLYLVKTQVEALNGKIKVESAVGKWTIFTIVFPT